MKNAILAALVAIVVVPAVVSGGAEYQEIRVQLTVPDGGWTLAIVEVVAVEGELWVLSQASREADVMGIMVISTVADTVHIEAPDLPVKHFILGKRWGWENKEPYTFLESRNQIAGSLESGRTLYLK